MIDTLIFILAGVLMGAAVALAMVMAMIGAGGLIFTGASIYHYFADIVKEKLHERRTSRK